MNLISRALLVFLLGGSAVLLGAPLPKEKTKDELIKDELGKLKGTWKIVSFQKDGEEIDFNGQLSVTFDGRDYTFDPKELGTGAITDIDPTQKVKRISYKLKSDGAKTDYGIYMLEGDVFIDCFVTGDDKKRPTEFKSTPKSGVSLVVYKRMKVED